jgi:hypothetical protein
VRNDGAQLGTLSSGAVDPLFDETWHHVAVTVSGGAVTLYVDGAPAGSGTSTFFAGVTGVDTAGIGRNKDSASGGGQWFFDGFMDEFALWSRPLSDLEIRYLAEEGDKGNPVVPPEPDSDGDGMPDSYEIANDLDPNSDDADDDLDGDGQKNLDEYLAGTAANDPNSLLRISSLLGDPLELTIIWSSVPGKIYAVEASPDLSPGSWVTLPGAEAIPATAGETTDFEDTSSEGLSQRFFRVRLVR